MSRLELYHHKTKQFSWRNPFVSIFAILIVAAGLVTAWYFYATSIRIDSPNDNFGRKVVIQLPSGQTVYTFENLISKKAGKMYYKGETNTIDLTGGKITYENWK